jgi:hypothetical protein
MEAALTVPLSRIFGGELMSQLTTSAIMKMRAAPRGWEARVVKFERVVKAGRQYFSARFKKISSTHVLIAFWDISEIVQAQDHESSQRETADMHHAK